MKKLFCMLILFKPLLSWATMAQPVPIPEDQSLSPQIELAAVGIGTLNYGRTAEHDGQGTISFSDSSLLVGASQRLYDEAIGSFTLGGVTTDAADAASNDSSGLFIHQAFVNYQSAQWEFLAGRTDNPSAHTVDFPTLRGDDLITLLNPLNPFSNGESAEEHRYSNVVSATLNQNLSYFENIHAQHLINSVDTNSGTGINSAGITFQYLAPPGLEVFDRVPSWGFSYDYVHIDSNGTSGISQISAGGVINLNKSVTDLIDLHIQDILSVGSNISTFQTLPDTFQADSNSVAASLRYLNSPFGKGGYQLALTAAYKNYLKVTGANSWGTALSAIKRLGQGFDLAIQYQGQWRSTELAAIQSKGIDYEQSVDVGLVFSFDTIFNQHISPRRSLLNQQHQYIPN
ncbi:hypothetical protein [Bdellovibrio sp. NC01]|uniref:hypothetical protein n=1 Tax=Bdellovibrio sp. NC01 TaxID=2220073 RepID=UPI00115B27EF|nr:hypothetical protein [Bdellovibrio sp. NC01]QDK38589.1 hypothetical protein DOE51_13875 [Bdellovibrio sp. NC01]